MSALAPLALVASALALAPAGSQPAGGDDSAARMARAVELRQQAERALADGDLAGALRAAQASYEALPSGRTAYNVAVVQRALGQRDAAFEQLLAGLNLGPSPEVCAYIEEQLAEVGPALSPPRGWLTVETSPPGAEVEVEGARAGQRTPVVLGLSAGEHTVTLRREGYRPAVAVAEVRVGAGAQLVQSLVPEPPAQAPQLMAVERPTLAEVRAQRSSGDQPARSAGVGAPPSAASASSPWLLGVGVSLAGVGGVALAACGAGVLVLDRQVSDPYQVWAARQQAAQLGTGAAVGAAAAAVVTVAGIGIAAAALLSDHTPD